MCGICSKIVAKMAFAYISEIVLIFPLLTWKKKMPADDFRLK